MTTYELDLRQESQEADDDDTVLDPTVECLRARFRTIMEQIIRFGDVTYKTPSGRWMAIRNAKHFNQACRAWLKEENPTPKQWVKAAEEILEDRLNEPDWMHFSDWDE